jgi:hypothetical protein
MTNDQLQADIELLKKQKEKLDAEKATLESQQALDKLKEVPNASILNLKDQKALADAKRDAANSQLEAWKAQNVGMITGSSFSGAVDLKDKAGQVEAALLAANAVRRAAGKICDAIKGKTTKCEVFAASEFPNFQRLQTFRFQREMMKLAFETAVVNPPAKSEEKPSVRAEVAAPGFGEAALLPVPAAAAVSAGLDMFSKITSFFKTDYTVGGLQLTLDESLLVFSVSGKLAEANTDVRLPMTYLPDAKNRAISALTRELVGLTKLRALASAQMESKNKESEEWERKLVQMPDSSEKQALLKTVSDARIQAEQIKGAIASYDGFANGLATPDPKTGAIPLVGLAQELAIEEVLEGNGTILLLRLENTGGGYFIKKNLWTGLFGMPLYHMGGATVTYALFSGEGGKLLAGDVVPVHGGFVKAGNVERSLKQ